MYHRILLIYEYAVVLEFYYTRQCFYKCVFFIAINFIVTMMTIEVLYPILYGV